jgi:NAD(P)-dependent dehydrogenase (short-subunit alcohol dehydrogenase family)
VVPCISVQVSQLFDLSGKTALVTGGGRGLGRYLALGLAEAGADVCVVSRKLDACQAVASEVEQAGVRGLAFQADLSQPAAIDALVQDVTQQAGDVDILVNNAARVWAAPSLDYPLSGWDRVFDLNVKGLFYLSQHFGRAMVERGAGSIIQIASISAWRGAGDDEQPVIAYNASKGAVVALTTDLAVKLAPHGVRVNAIAPGPFRTDMMNHIRHDAQRLAQYESLLPLGRSGQEDDIKGVVVFLASEASRFITGQTLVVDGGLMCVGPPQGRI